MPTYKYEVTCTCDEIGDEPCPAHGREHKLQDRCIELQTDIVALQYDLDVAEHERDEALKELEKWKNASNEELEGWIIDRWDEEVSNRPLQNIHRRTLDCTWRQIYRYVTGEELPRPQHINLVEDK